MSTDLIIGCMRLGQWGAKMNTAELQDFIEHALALGFDTFDHADIYGDYTTEGDFGKVLKSSLGLRDKMNLISKCGIRMLSDNRPEHRLKSYDSSKAHIIASAENSLKELCTDHLDLLLLHRPDYLMDPEEVAEAFEILRKSGKVKEFGVSNFSPSQFDLLNDCFELSTNQIEFSSLHLDALDNGQLDQCQRNGIRPQIWSPFGGAALFNGQNERSEHILKVADEIADEHGKSMNAVLLAWIMRHPSLPIPVVGTTKKERLDSYAQAMAMELSREQWYRILEAASGRRVL